MLSRVFLAGATSGASCALLQTPVRPLFCPGLDFLLAHSSGHFTSCSFANTLIPPTIPPSSQIEVVKCRAQAESAGPGDGKKKLGSFKIARLIAKNDGLRGFYIGGLMTACRDGISSGIFFWGCKWHRGRRWTSVLLNTYPVASSGRLCFQEDPTRAGAFHIHFFALVSISISISMEHRGRTTNSNHSDAFRERTGEQTRSGKNPARGRARRKPECRRTLSVRAFVSSPLGRSADSSPPGSTSSKPVFKPRTWSPAPTPSPPSPPPLPLSHPSPSPHHPDATFPAHHGVLPLS